MLFVAFVLRMRQLEWPNAYQFDEDMHAYTANLMIQGDNRVFEWWHRPFEQERSPYLYRAPAIEWLHPPLAKYFQASSIFILGNQPLAWRLPSALVGVGVVWIGMLLAKLLSRNSLVALLTGVVLAIEPLLIAQSQLASPDIFVAFFVLLGLFWYWQWQQKMSTRYLFLAGLTLGLALGTKWTGGLALLGITVYELSRWVVERRSQGSKDRWSSIRELLIIFALSAVVYCIVYTPALFTGKSVADITQLHQQIWQYQTSATFVHPNQSSPAQWLFGQKPVWYSFEQLADGTVRERVAQPWPLLPIISLALGLTALFITARSTTRRSELRPLLYVYCVIVAFWLPWFFVSRPLFIYHLTPVVPLLVIGLSLSVSSLFKKQSIA